jgi:hypothetical protein
MEGIPREESARLPSYDDLKGLWKGYLGKNPPDYLPRTTRKGYGRDTQGRIRPTSFLGRLERVMEGISREESARLPSSNDLKGYGRDTQGRIHPTSFLERPERVIEGIPREESARLPSLNDSKRLWKGFPGKKPLDWGFQKG